MNLTVSLADTRAGFWDISPLRFLRLPTCAFHSKRPLLFGMALGLNLLGQNNSRSEVLPVQSLPETLPALWMERLEPRVTGTVARWSGFVKCWVMAFLII